MVTQIFVLRACESESPKLSTNDNLVHGAKKLTILLRTCFAQNQHLLLGKIVLYTTVVNSVITHSVALGIIQSVLKKIFMIAGSINMFSPTQSLTHSPIDSLASSRSLSPFPGQFPQSISIPWPVPTVYLHSLASSCSLSPFPGQFLQSISIPWPVPAVYLHSLASSRSLSQPILVAVPLLLLNIWVTKPG